jgi:hypothetical protein
MDILAESPPTTRFSSLSESSSDGLADTDACLVIAAAPLLDASIRGEQRPWASSAHPTAAPFVEFYIAR